MKNLSIDDSTPSADIAARIERRWATVAVGIVTVMVCMVIYTGLHWGMMPPSRDRPSCIVR